MQTGKTMEINKPIIGAMREMIMEIKMSGIERKIMKCKIKSLKIFDYYLM
jgi:hypothetical protein